MGMCFLLGKPTTEFSPGYSAELNGVQTKQPALVTCCSKRGVRVVPEVDCGDMSQKGDALENRSCFGN